MHQVLGVAEGTDMTAQPTWIELDHGLSAAVGTLRRGRRGFFVLGRKSASSRRPRLIVASGHFEDGRVVIVTGVLSSDVLSELEQQLRGHATQNSIL
jgi:hypothetical protein